jgi:perosamine synthetase
VRGTGGRSSVSAETLALDGGAPVADRPVTFPWPVVTPEMERILVTQAREALSVYDGSGVVGRFEGAFARYLGVPFALATSSGTAALYSLYYGLGLQAGDEVICSDYGFFATATPLLLLGARPVFVDCGKDGTLAPEEAEAAITPQTRAIVVTHMWGAPARVDELAALCDRHGIALIEDCSHAHGTRLGSRLAGSFGQGAAWSLQAGKSLWAGEGGILVTAERALFERAVLVGHFNRRALEEIPAESSNFPYAFTGTGLKFRAHPLGLALAEAQLSGLDALIWGRQKAAEVLEWAILDVPGVRLLSESTPDAVHSYYALIAVVDPRSCGFTRERFVEALWAENISSVSVPGQMGRLSKWPVFGGHHDSWRLGPNAGVIEATAVKFFVPSTAGGDETWAQLELVAQAIRKVGRCLSADRSS